MRILTMALLLAATWFCPTPPAHAQAPADTALHECRLEHPLHLTSAAARCRLLHVAEDPDHPAGAGIDLQVAVIPALNRRSTAPPLFVLAGGPGQGAIDLYMTTAPAFGRIARDHDIVLVDQRGTGRSHPLRCDYPEDWNENANALPVLRAATARCLEKLGPGVRFYTTSVAVRDLDAVRRALGYPKISLYGASYGTRVAELYMRRYPQFVDAVILDGVVLPQKVLGPDTPLDGERALQAILARCADTRDCALAFPKLAGEWLALRERFGPQRLELSLPDPDNGTAQTVQFNRTLLAASLRLMSYSAAQASLLPLLIHRAATGELPPLAAQGILFSREVGGLLATGMQMSVLCSEDVPLFAAAHVDRGRLGATYQGTDQIDALQEICTLWPRGPVDADLHEPLHSDIPTLLLSGEADPVTPPADAEELARGLSRHRHLILAGEGHGQLGTGCMPRLMAEFLNSTDPPRIDARCLSRHRPPPFFLGFTGPAP